MQIWTGKQQRTLTQQVISKAASRAGLSQNDAENVGAFGDMVVGTALGTGTGKMISKASQQSFVRLAPVVSPSSTVAQGAAKGVTAPKGWITQASKKGGGTVFKDPHNPHNMIRQMPGNQNSPNVLQQNPYVKFMKDGKFYDVNGKVLPNGNVPGAHIPLSQFDILKMPKF